MKKTIITILSLCFFVSCENQEDKVTQPSKDGSVEVKLSTTHVGDNKHDIMTAVFTYYCYKKQIGKTTIVDTLPSLGTIEAESEEDDNGYTQKAIIPKDYEIYITVAPVSNPNKTKK